MKPNSVLIGSKLTITDSKGNPKVYDLRKGQIEAIKCIDANFTDNFLFIAPTAYGKTLVAIHYILKMQQEDLKTIYCVPLKALSAEMEKTLTELGLKVIEDTGEKRKTPLEDYENSDVVLTTNERLDSVLRNEQNLDAFESFGLAVIDECHNIHSDSRGVNLESLIVKLKNHTGLTLMGMSATAPNFVTLAEFLNAKFVFVLPTERPVKQRIYIHYYQDTYRKETMLVRNAKIREIINNLILKHKQALIFCSSQDRCEVLAREFSGIKSRSVMDLIKKSNYAWHYARLLPHEKEAVETSFKEGKTKFIFATPTLAQGVNLPAYCVVMYDLYRYSGLRSQDELIEPMEVEQSIGRAGRPQYGETECDVHIFAKNTDKPYRININDIKSNLSANLDTVLNEWICSGINNMEEITSALDDTFLMKDILKQDNSKELAKVLMAEVNRSMDFLEENGFITIDSEEFRSTFLGKMTAVFYIKPITALHFNKFARIFYDKITSRFEVSDLEIVAGLLNNEEFLNKIRVDKEKDHRLVELCNKEFSSISNFPREYYDERIMKAIPMIFQNTFNSKYGAKIVVYSTDFIELDKILDRLLKSAEVIIIGKELKKRIKDLRIMIKTRSLDRGIAELRSIQTIGDVRINRLLDAGIKDITMFLSTKDERLMEIMRVSKKTIQKMKEEAMKCLKPVYLKEEIKKWLKEVKAIKEYSYKKDKKDTSKAIL